MERGDAVRGNGKQTGVDQIEDGEIVRRERHADLVERKSVFQTA